MGHFAKQGLAGSQGEACGFRDSLKTSLILIEAFGRTDVRPKAFVYLRIIGRTSVRPYARNLDQPTCLS